MIHESSHQCGRHLWMTPTYDSVPAVVGLVREPPHPVAVLEVAQVAPRLVRVEPRVQQRLVHGVTLPRLHLEKTWTMTQNTK